MFNEKPTWIYVFSAPGRLSPRPHSTIYKIGRSDDPANRIRSIQRANPFAAIICAWRGFAFEEQLLHQRYSKHRIGNTEWFDISFAQLDEISRHFTGRERIKWTEETLQRVTLPL